MKNNIQKAPVISQIYLSKKLFLEASKYVDMHTSVDAGIAISMFQDAVELLVWLCLKEKDISVKEKSLFTENLGKLEDANLKVPYKAKLLELNTSRVNFKHYGNIPALEEAAKKRVYVESFLRDAMMQWFEVDFDKISLVDLVQDETIREILRLAEKSIVDGQNDEALKYLAQAKSVLFGYMSKALPVFRGRLSNYDDILQNAFSSQSVNPFSWSRRVGHPFRDIEQYFDVLREVILINMFQIAIDDYQFLMQYLPQAYPSSSGDWKYFGRPFPGKTEKTEKTDMEKKCRRALMLIVDMVDKVTPYIKNQR